MLSKEKIEKKLEQTECDEITINLLYQKVDLLENEIEQLKTDKQKLIEKLEEEHGIVKNKYSETLSPYQYGKLDIIEEILSFVEGEKDADRN